MKESPLEHRSDPPIPPPNEDQALKNASFLAENNGSSDVAKFVKNQGLKKILKHWQNGRDYRPYYEGFRLAYPQSQLTFEEFNEEVIECIHKTIAATAAEVAAIPGSMAGSGLNQLLSSPAESVGHMAFTGSILLNFVAFATVWLTSHRSHFIKENGSFDAAQFAKSLMKEYGAHFGPIAIGADLLESVIIQALANHEMNSVAASALVTSLGSAMAVVAYFYEQKARVAINKKLAKIDTDKGMIGAAAKTRDAVYKKLAPYGPLFHDIGKVF